MRIQSINHITKAYGIQTQGMPNVQKTDKKDEVNISNKANDFQYAFKLASQVADVRQDKIEDIKARMQAGTYSVAAKEVSEKIVRQIDIQG